MKTENYINSMESMESMVTTISLSEEMRDKLKNLGRTGESYDEVLRRMYEIVRKNMIRAYLYDTTDCITAEEALKEAKKKWPKS